MGAHPLGISIRKLEDHLGRGWPDVKKDTRSEPRDTHREYRTNGEYNREHQGDNVERRKGTT